MPALELENVENGPDIHQAEAHFRRVLASQQFVRAEALRRVLEYMWQHRAETLSEYALATEALGRKSDFDSALDASVRVHVSRLRRKLKDYYQETGEPEQLRIPTGSYQLVIEPPGSHVAAVVPEPAPSPIAPPAALPSASLRSRPLALWLIGVALALCCTAVLGWWAGRRSAARVPAKPTVFWSDFLQGSTAPIKIILPTPTFFRFANNRDLRIRSTRVNDFEDINKDATFQALAQRLGTPELEQHYTVTSDTLAALGIARYLYATSGADHVSFDAMRDSDMVVLEQSNVIALGTSQTLHPLRQYLDSMNFSLNHDEVAALNAKPLSGEQGSYQVVQQSPERIVRPSVIAVLPGRSPGMQVLIVESRDTAAIVDLLTSQAGANSVHEMLQAHGSPRFWEMVVETELNSDKPIRTWPVTMHAYTKTAPSSAM